MSSTPVASDLSSLDSLIDTALSDIQQTYKNYP
jgi:hypothetical protein